MECVQTITVYDISNKLGVHPFTVRRWILGRKLRGTKASNRGGYKIKINDFEDFLVANPRYTSIKDENLPYELAKAEVLKDLMMGLYDLQKEFLLENHGKVYSEGWNAAIEKVDGLIKECFINKR